MPEIPVIFITYAAFIYFTIGLWKSTSDIEFESEQWQKIKQGILITALWPLFMITPVRQHLPGVILIFVLLLLIVPVLLL